MSANNDQPRMLGKKKEDASLGEVIEFVKTYAKQETLGPLKGAGSWLIWGTAAALTMGLGLMIVMLGVLRMFQTELEFSLLAYLFTLIISVVLLGLTLWRVKKSTLNNEPK